MMRRISVLCLFLQFLAFSGVGQQWNRGTILLQSNERWSGSLSIAFGHDVVLCKEGERVNVIPVFKIKSLYCYDSLTGVNRKFVSLTEDECIRKRQKLFEVIVSGELMVVRKIVPVVTSMLDEKWGYDYFVVSDNALTSVRKFKSKIYSKLKINPAIEYFVMANRLHFDKASDVVRIVEFYNDNFALEQIATTL